MDTPSASPSYAEVLKKPKLINSGPSVKFINPQTQVFCHKIKAFRESQLINFVDEAHQKKRQAKAKLTREDILKLNSKQLASFKDSVKKRNRKVETVPSKDLGKSWTILQSGQICASSTHQRCSTT